jgi:hypothetical protein
MKIKLISSIIISALLVSCSTGYHSRNFAGGYSEIRTNPDSFIITFTGNSYTSSERVFKYSLLRASELTLKNEYAYFIIVSSVDQSSSYNYSNITNTINEIASVYNNSSQSYGSTSVYSGTVVKPGASIAIKCFKEKPQFEESFDAKFYWENNSDKELPINGNESESYNNRSYK